MDTTIPTAKIQEFIDQQIENAMPTLIEFLEIPS